MKKVITVILVVAVVFLGITVLKDGVISDIGFSQTQSELKENLESNINIYPFYASLDEEYKDYYIRIYLGLENYDKSIGIVEFDSEDDLNSVKEWLDENYKNILYEQPDFFWVSPYEYSYEIIRIDKTHTLKITPAYTVPEESLEEKKIAYNRAVDEIVDVAKNESMRFKSLLYVYDTILENTEYDNDLAEGKREDDIARSAYGCLVDGKTVCSGYTLAFTSIMQKLGIPCGAEFNDMVDGLIKGDGHVWNYCEIGGKYYYFDLTWDDGGIDFPANGKTYLDYRHEFFAINRDELKRTHDYLDNSPKAYVCDADEYNYYVFQNMYCNVYSEDSLRAAMLRQASDDYITVKFSSQSDRQRAEDYLFKNQKIFEIFPDFEQVNYAYSNSGLHLYIFGY